MAPGALPSNPAPCRTKSVAVVVGVFKIASRHEMVSRRSYQGGMEGEAGESSVDWLVQTDDRTVGSLAIEAGIGF